MRSDSRRVLVTGDSGRVGRVVVADLSRDHQVTGFSVNEFAHGGEVRSVVGDIADAAALDRAFAGVSAVVHLAGDPRPEAPWPSTLHANIDGTYQMFEAARRAGVGRVVFASSSHVTGLLTEQGLAVGSATPAAPNSLYAVSKLAGEAMGRLYSERYGMSVICLRIGYLNEADDPWLPIPVVDAGPAPTPEVLAEMWISHRDLAQIVRRCLAIDTAMDSAADSVRFGVFYAISGNTGARWDISDARSVLGYAPQDDSTLRSPDRVTGGDRDEAGRQ